MEIKKKSEMQYNRKWQEVLLIAIIIILWHLSFSYLWCAYVHIGSWHETHLLLWVMIERALKALNLLI